MTKIWHDEKWYNLISVLIEILTARYSGLYIQQQHMTCYYPSLYSSPNMALCYQMSMATSGFNVTYV
jgi:hypothetical protein